MQQLLAQLGRQIGLGVIEKRGDVVLQSALAPALVIEKKRLPLTQHDVARLKIAIQKIVAVRGQQKAGEAAEIVFQRLLTEGNARQAEKIVFEVIQVPGDGLAIKTAARIAKLI